MPHFVKDSFELATMVYAIPLVYHKMFLDVGCPFSNVVLHEVVDY